MKQFYVISSLSTDRSYHELNARTQYETKEAAVDAAKRLIMSRSRKNQPELSFFVLQATCHVGHEIAPIVVTDLEDI